MTTPFEADPADAAEQALPAAGADAADDPATALPTEADPADAAEQGAVVETDEDERR